MLIHQILPKNLDLASLKTEVDKIDIDGIEMVPVMLIIILLKRLDMMSWLKKS